MAPEKIAAVFGEKGVSNDDHIVVYDGDAWRAAFMLSVLDYLGAEHISFLKGGIQTWRLDGNVLSGETVQAAAKTFTVNPQPDFIVDNQTLLENLDHPRVVVDIRTLDQCKKLAKHPKALRSGPTGCIDCHPKS